MTEAVLAAEATDGHCWQLAAIIPAQPVCSLFWLPAMGVAARHYLPFAQSLALHGIAVFLHEWRGSGTSNMRPGRTSDWGYRELLELDLPASEAVVARATRDMPRLIGGHSLGGQLACCHAGRSAGRYDGLWLVASGAPYWRAFPARTRWWLPMAYRFLPWLAERRGFLPGHRIGFGGNEARSLVRDWARTALSGRYAAAGMQADLEGAMAGTTTEVRAVVLAKDWLAPESSTRFLLSKMPNARHRIGMLDVLVPSGRAAHFDWMKQPGAVAGWLLEGRR